MPDKYLIKTTPEKQEGQTYLHFSFECYLCPCFFMLHSVLGPSSGLQCQSQTALFILQSLQEEKKKSSCIK
ncbi:hypothetical protein FKM82_010585 [Ascaphus truei]